MRRAARLLSIVGWAIVVLAALHILGESVHAWWLITHGPTDTPTDRARILANGIATGMFTSLFLLPGAVLCGAGWWLGRRAKQRESERERH